MKMQVLNEALSFRIGWFSCARCSFAVVFSIVPFLKSEQCSPSAVDTVTEDAASQSTLHWNYLEMTLNKKVGS